MKSKKGTGKMGHLQDMNREQRLKFQAMQYKAMKEARRGNSFTYLNDDALKKLCDRGYVYHIFETNGVRKHETGSVEYAKEEVEKLRKDKKHFARIVVNPSYNIRGCQTYSILKKTRK